MNNLQSIDQEHVEVEVEYYDQKDQNLLAHYPTAKEIGTIVQNGLKIPIPEFLTYYLFHRKRHGIEGLGDYSELSQNIGSALSNLEHFVEFNGNSISAAKGIGTQLNEITEHVGESIGLSVISSIHGLTEADWDKIPESRGPHALPSLDYEIVASDGKDIIQVETKGSFVKDNTQKTGSIYTHRSSIRRKKEKISESLKKGSYPYPANIRYGTIVAFDSRSQGVLKCWIADPEADIHRMNPLQFRILSRIKFLRDWISFLSPRSQLASALATRVAALESLDDPSELDNIPLIKRYNEPFDLVPFSHTYRLSTWLANKSRVSDRAVGGIALPLRKGLVFFLGIREELVMMAQKQGFEEITEYRAETGTTYEKVECVVSKGRFREFDLPGEFKDSVRESGGYVRFFLRGQIHYSAGGVAFGLLSIEP